jgi:Tfp pilus assembly protein PilE
MRPPHFRTRLWILMIVVAVSAVCLAVIIRYQRLIRRREFYTQQARLFDRAQQECLESGTWFASRAMRWASSNHPRAAEYKAGAEKTAETCKESAALYARLKEGYELAATRPWVTFIPQYGSRARIAQAFLPWTPLVPPPL